jgi:hypothetical protein
MKGGNIPKQSIEIEKRKLKNKAHWKPVFLWRWGQNKCA